MMIVASNSITLSNVNDGTITHIAYADSADGKDGFYVGGGTNLLLNTQSFDSNWVWVNIGYSFANGFLTLSDTTSNGTSRMYQTITDGNLNGKTLSLSFNAKISADCDSQLVQIKAGPYDDLKLINVTSKDPQLYKIENWQWLSSSPNFSFYVINGKVDISKLKLEYGSVATPRSSIYMGTYTDYTQADSLDPTAYQWSQIKGADGKDGVPGKDGLGIKSTAIAYQLSPSGTTTPTGTWSTTVPTLTKGQYLWTRTTLTYTDNTTEPVYSVSYVAKDGNNGSNGVAGKDGVGIKTTTITYATSTSGTSAPTSGWVSTPPTATAGQFVWTRTIWTYTDNTTETGYSVGKIGEKGATGSTGNGVKSTAVTYQSSTSGMTPPAGTWSTSIPSVGAGNYLWTRTITTYTDGTSATMYAVGMMGATGPKGDPGSKDVPVITSGTSFPSTRKTGDMHWMTNSAGVVTGYYKFDGSQWVVQKIDAQSLNVSSLSALSANLGNVTAGTINGVTINGSTYTVPYKHANLDGYRNYTTGSMTISGGKVTIEGNVESEEGVDSGQRYGTTLSPSGFNNYVTDDDGITYLNQTSIVSGVIGLSTLVSGSGNTAVYNSASLDALKIKQLNTAGRLLWSGTRVMNDTESITPSVPLSDCLNGWSLLWSQVNSDGSYRNSRFIYQIILKMFGEQHPTFGMTFPIAAPSDSNPWGNAAAKYLFVDNTTLNGYVSNNQGAANGYALREVREF